MLLAVETVAVEEVEVLVIEVTAEDVEEDMDEVEEDMAKEVMEEAMGHIKKGLKSHMSPVTLNM